MFDMMLSFWVLSAVLAIVTSATRNDWKPQALLTIATAGGLLTKGPVIFVHVGPVFLFARWWNRERKPGAAWYAKTFSAMLLGIVITAFWVIPAVITGGPAYRNSLLYSQTVNRVVSSFAHQRAFWWYLPLLPMFFFPWCFYRASWAAMPSLREDTGKRLCFVWFLSALVILSLISGKQIYYLLPDFPALIILFAAGLALTEQNPSRPRRTPVLIAALYFILSIRLFVEPFLPIGFGLDSMSTKAFGVLAVGALCIGSVLLFFKTSRMENTVMMVGCSTSLILMLFILSGHHWLKRYDISKVATQVARLRETGTPVANIGTYYGQYQFLGRLKQPIPVLADIEDIRNFASKHPEGVLIDDGLTTGKYRGATIIYEQQYRAKKIVLWKAGEYLEQMEKDLQVKSNAENG